MSPRFGLRRRATATEPDAEVDGAKTADTAPPAIPAPAEPAARPTSIEAVEPARPVDAVEPSAVEPAELEAAEPAVRAARRVGRDLAQLAGYDRAVLSWVAADGYPMNVDIAIEVRASEGSVRFNEPIGFTLEPGTIVAITGSRICALPEGGLEGRTHATVWGVASARPRARFAVYPTRTWVWDEDELPLPVTYERDLPKARRYFETLSAERTEPVRPKPPSGLIAFRVVHAPFLGATFAPVLLGLAVAARSGVFDVIPAVLTLAAVSAVHLGLNVGRDLFDALRGVGDAGATPAESEAHLHGNVAALREIAAPAVACYAVAAAIGVALLVTRGSPALAIFAAAGLLIGAAYALPPIKLAHRGFDEIATAIVFGPLLLAGTYLIQSGGGMSLEALVLSVPVGLLAAVIVLVHGIRCREADAKAGRSTLPVRLSRSAVVTGYGLAAAGAFIVMAVGVAIASLPIPALTALVTIPLALRIRSGLARSYDEPHVMLDTAAESTLLHANFTLFLLLTYLMVVADMVFFGLRPYFW
jgi:1,4-dihydroxy-2-naphthoate polyprenyltransferase